MNDAFGPSLLEVAAILGGATLAGRWIVLGLLPRGPAWSLERWGWSVAAGLALLALGVAASLALGIRPGFGPFAAVAAAAVLAARRFALPRLGSAIPERPRSRVVPALLLVAIACGIAAYAARSLAEPMWSNDFLAVWGLKGKTIFADAALPRSLFRWPDFEFSNPGYPIGLPLVYAGIAFLLGRWDDHAMALLFPVFQVATLLVLAGWLRRRGVSSAVTLAAGALAANFAFLYSAWLTGMAEVPVSFALLLVGTAFCDALENTDPGCRRRLVLASLLAAATKNEGLFFVATATAILLIRAARRRERPPWSLAAALAIPALGSFVLHRLVLGKHPVRGLDIALLRQPGLGARLIETFREDDLLLLRPCWPAIASLVLLAVLARRNPATRRILLLVGTSLAIYLLLPAICSFGPSWFIHWTVGRIAAALFPLLLAGLGAGWTDTAGSAPLR